MGIISETPKIIKKLRKCIKPLKVVKKHHKFLCFFMIFS